MHLIGIVFAKLVYSLPQSMTEHGIGNLSSGTKFFNTNPTRQVKGNTTQNQRYKKLFENIDREYFRDYYY